MNTALQRCEEFKDSEKTRQDMREQILETPPHLRQDLLDHFKSTQSHAPAIPLKKQRENNHDQ
jgi:hypothetical protein